MNTFYIFLNDPATGSIDWGHPQILNGQSKEEIQKLLVQDIPPESIHSILTESEYQTMMAGMGKNAQEMKMDQAASISLENCESTNDFFQQMLKAGNSIGSMNMGGNETSISVNDTGARPSIGKALYFTEGNIKFKLENNILYKEDWVDVDPNLDSEKCSYRIMNKTTKKVVVNDKYGIQQLSWVPVKND